MCASGVFWGDGRRLFSADDNLREEIPFMFFPDDWRRDTYYGLWLVVEWTGVFLSIVAMVRLTHFHYTCINALCSFAIDCLYGAPATLHTTRQE